ncbi:hypothetical protein BD410DRAFT_802154 [Rickenella mellea]|uniref:Uncharacterized protein n=1 Tax=Rickenella mellea TaxID=50990 RepID=A0A4Y7Q9S0_9AGAM|nr:hypothetical protein BD410DRAFT_802154 [Rickenella mellea]
MMQGFSAGFFEKSDDVVGGESLVNSTAQGLGKVEPGQMPMVMVVQHSLNTFQMAIWLAFCHRLANAFFLLPLSPPPAKFNVTILKMTASYVPNKAVRDDQDGDEERCDSGNPRRRGSTTETPLEDQWLVLLIIYLIRAAVHSIGYVYNVGSSIVANIPREFTVNALASAAEQQGILAPANNTEEPFVPDFPVHMPHFDPTAGPDTHLGRRWDEELAATSGVSGQSQRRFTSFAMARNAFEVAMARRNVRYVPDEDEDSEPGPSDAKGKPPKRDDEGPGASGTMFDKLRRSKEVNTRTWRKRDTTVAINATLAKRTFATNNVAAATSATALPSSSFTAAPSNAVPFFSSKVPMDIKIKKNLRAVCCTTQWLSGSILSLRAQRHSVATVWPPLNGKGGQGPSSATHWHHANGLVIMARKLMTPQRLGFPRLPPRLPPVPPPPLQPPTPPNVQGLPIILFTPNVQGGDAFGFLDLQAAEAGDEGDELSEDELPEERVSKEKEVKFRNRSIILPSEPKIFYFIMSYPWVPIQVIHTHGYFFTQSLTWIPTAKAVRKVKREDNWLRYLERRLTGVKPKWQELQRLREKWTGDGPEQRWTEVETEQTERRSSGQPYTSTLSGRGNFAMQRAFGLTEDGKKRSLGAQHESCDRDN